MAFDGSMFPDSRDRKPYRTSIGDRWNGAWSAAVEIARTSPRPVGDSSKARADGRTAGNHQEDRPDRSGDQGVGDRTGHFRFVPDPPPRNRSRRFPRTRSPANRRTPRLRRPSSPIPMRPLEPRPSWPRPRLAARPIRARPASLDTPRRPSAAPRIKPSSRPGKRTTGRCQPGPAARWPGLARAPAVIDEAQGTTDPLAAADPDDAHLSELAVHLGRDQRPGRRECPDARVPRQRRVPYLEPSATVARSSIPAVRSSPGSGSRTSTWCSPLTTARPGPRRSWMCCALAACRPPSSSSAPGRPIVRICSGGCRPRATRWVCTP